MIGRRSSEGDSQGSLYAYFMIRVERTAPEHPHQFSGMIERLGTGEKWSFDGRAELIELLGSWPGGSFEGCLLHGHVPC